MGSAAVAYPDVQTTGSHLDRNVSLQKYSYERLLEYWTMVYTLGLLARLAGTKEEQDVAKQAVIDALEGAVKEAGGLLDAAAVAVDDYTPPGVGALGMLTQRGTLWATQSVGRFFGKDAGLDDDIENMDRRIRDSVAVDVNQTSQVMKAGKATLESVGKSTGLWDYKADTRAEDGRIAATQGTVDARNAQVRAAIDKVWNAVVDVATRRYNQFLADWKKGGLDYAVGTLGIDAAFLAVEVAISAAAGALTGGVGAVALKVSVSVGKQIGRVARAIRVTFKRAGGNAGRAPSFPVSERKVVDHAKKHDGFGDDHAGLPKSTHDNQKDPGGPKVASAGPGKKKLTRGTPGKENENTLTYDPKTGRPTNANGTLRSDFGSTPRGDNATAVGKLGDSNDQGGHLVAHRFMGDTPNEGIVPQAGNLNMGAWKTMENEWADWIKKGYEVDYNIDVKPPGAVRPDAFDVRYTIRDPKTGTTKYANRNRFRNVAGQKFSRISFRDME